MRIVLMLLALFGIGMLPHMSSADEGAARGGFETWKTGAVEDLAGLAAWCHRSRLFGSRNDAYERVLRLDPEHTKARLWLRYKKAQDGRWSRPGPYKHPRNLKPGGEAFTKRTLATGDRIASAALAMLRTHRDTLPASLRSRALWEAALNAPNRSDVRKLNGEVKDTEGSWTLVETQASDVRRTMLEQCAKRGLAAAGKGKPVGPTARESLLPLKWSTVLQTPRVRMMGTPDAMELKAGVARVEASFPLFQAAFGALPADMPRFTIYVLQSRREQASLLRSHWLSTKQHAKRVATSSSAWMPKSSHLFIRSSSSRSRLEFCARQPIYRLMRTLSGGRRMKGWAIEGFGLYLTYLVAGRRRTIFVQRTRYSEDSGERRTDLWDTLRAPDSDWREEARKLLESNAKPDIALLLDKNVNTMNTEEMLTSYVLAAYCLEGRAAESRRLLQALGKDQTSSAKALGQVLGLDPGLLEERLIRWLDETR